jgi:hypothetical protein
MRESCRVRISNEEKMSWLYIDNLRHDVFFDHSTRVRFLQLANRNFDSDFEKVSENFKDHQYGSYLWVFTSEFIRGEEISSLLRWHFIMAMIIDLNNKSGIKEVLIETRIPANMMLFLNKLKITTKYSKLGYVRSITRYISKGILYSLKNIKKNFTSLLARQNTYHEGVIVDINRSFTMHRYDNLEKVVKIYPSIKYYSGQEHKLQDVPKIDNVVFRNELTAGILLKAINKSCKIVWFMIRSKEKIPIDLYYNLTDIFNIINLYDLIIYEKCIERYLNKNKIKKVLHVSTFTRPTYRILMTAACRNHTQFILVASRTLIYYRSSDRLLNCDVMGYNMTALPSKFIVKDNYSASVFKHFPHLHKRVVIAGRSTTPKQKEFHLNKPTAILILFNH